MTLPAKVGHRSAFVFKIEILDASLTRPIGRATVLCIQFLDALISG